jgi:hypothetical protein
MTLSLYTLDKNLRHFLAAFILLLTVAVSTGLLFVYHTTTIETDGIIERYNGSQVDEDFSIPDEYPKSLFEMLLNTHNHLFGFAFIFLCIGILFYFNSIIGGGWKYFLMIEPFFSIILTFGGLWLIRYVDTSFVFLVLISAILTYLSYYIIIGIILYELLFKSKLNPE